jgi:hypothetical protein
MAWFRGSSPMKIASIAIGASAFWLMAAAEMAFGDDLKGYSIDATYTTHAVPGVVVAGEMPKHGLNPVQHHDRIYVSLLGNVFVYSDNSSGSFAVHGGNETQLDKARALPHDRMQAWTIETSRLLRINHEIEGVLVATYAIDPSRTTCTVSFDANPDPNTGRMVAQSLSGITLEIKSYSVTSATCAVRKGNIFASDQ